MAGGELGGLGLPGNSSPSRSPGSSRGLLRPLHQLLDQFLSSQTSASFLEGGPWVPGEMGTFLNVRDFGGACVSVGRVG